MIQQPTPPVTPAQLKRQEVLFSRENVNSISERFYTYIMQREMKPGVAWVQAVEDEAQLIQHKLELMKEGAMKWDWQAIQLDALRLGLETMVEPESLPVNQ